MEFEQQQAQPTTDVVPPSGGAPADNIYSAPQQTNYQPEGQSQQQSGGGVSSDTFPSFSWVKTPRGILRLFEFLFALIAFASTADVQGYDTVSKLKFVVAVGVLVWVYTLFLIVIYTVRAKIPSIYVYMPPVELALDGCFCVLLLAAGAASATWVNDNKDYLTGKPKRNLEAAVVFTFFNLILMIVSTFFSWRENASAERQR